MDVVNGLLIIIFILVLLYSPIAFVNMVIIYRVSKSIKECLIWIIQLVIIYVYCFIMIYITNTIKG